MSYRINDSSISQMQLKEKALKKQKSWRKELYVMNVNIMKELQTSKHLKIIFTVIILENCS